MGMPPLAGRSNVIDKSAKIFGSAFPDLTGELELTLVSGNDILAVVLLKGTHKGPLPGPQGEIAPTNKKIGYLVVHHVQTTPDGRSIAKERFMYDGGTFMSQLGVSPMPARKPLEQGWAEKPSLISSGTEAEKANVAALGAWTEAYNKHDATALSALMTDDVTFSDLASPADRVGKKEVQKSTEEMNKAFPDSKVTQSGAWAAGDYVVSTGRWNGTNSGDMPSMKLKKTGKPVSVEYYMVTKLAGGKVQKNWLFTNGMAFAGQLGILPAPKAAKPAPGAAAKDTKGPAAPAAAAPGVAKDTKGPAAPAAAAPGVTKDAKTPAGPAAGAPKTATPAPVAPPGAAAPKATPAPAAPGAAAPKAATPPPAPAPAPAPAKPPATK
jgi:predicted ester cyclase